MKWPMKDKNKESGYLTMGGIPRIKEEDRDWGGCIKEILESRKHEATLFTQKPTFQVRDLEREAKHTSILEQESMGR